MSLQQSTLYLLSLYLKCFEIESVDSNYGSVGLCPLNPNFVQERAGQRKKKRESIYLFSLSTCRY